ncbi:MAG TPA: type II secretion system protein [Candidatus Paceibacterota bacterium]|nr:type II secretion system protein [Candidatus Paceibacterota bacterium]
MKKGFTLIELLVVIAILAVLMSVVVVTINPAEMLKKTRDTKRISDLDALRTALNLYVTDQGNLGNVTSTNCYSHVSFTPGVSGCTGVTTVNGGGSQAVDSTGWIPINFKSITSGSPLSALPVDPKVVTTSTSTDPGGWHAYVFKGSTSTVTFKLMANMESAYYSGTSPNSVENTDGGASPEVYEVGSDLNL